MGSFKQKIRIFLPTCQFAGFILLNVICFNVNPISAHYVYPPHNKIYAPHHHYNLLAPKNMQLRRFMWSNEMGDFYKDVSSGAHAMRQMVMGSFVQPSLMKFRNYFQHASPSNHVKYVVRKPKNIVHVKKVLPKKIIKIVTIPTTQPQPQTHPTIPYPTKPTEYKFHSDNDKDKYINPEHDYITPKDTLRMIEEAEERRVEATISALFPINSHGGSSGEYNVVSGKIEEFDDSWKPIRGDGENIEQPQRAHPVSPLHTHVDGYANLKTHNTIEKIPYETTDDYVHLKHDKKFEKSMYDISPIHKKSEKKLKKLPYEVTEVSAEESIQIPQAFKVKKYDTNRFTKENVISGRSSSSSTSSTSTSKSKNNISSTSSTSSTILTSNKPNYPDYYLETFAKDYQVDCATKTPLVWKNISKKEISSTTQQNPTNTRNGSKRKKERQTNIQSVTTEKSSKLKPMRKYSSKIKKKSFRSTIRPSLKTDEPIDIQQEIEKFVTIKDDITEMQPIPTAFTTRIPDDYVKYVTTTTTTAATPTTTTNSSISKLNRFDRERIKKLRGAKKYGGKDKL